MRAALVILRARRRAARSVSAGVHVARIVVDARGAPVKRRAAALADRDGAGARARDRRAGRASRRSPAASSAPSSPPRSSPAAGRTAPEGGASSARAPAAAAVYGRFVGRHDELKRLGDILAQATRKRSRSSSRCAATRASARRASSPRWSAASRRATTTSASTSRRCPERRRACRGAASRRCSQVLCGIQEGDDEERILDVLPRLRALGLQRRRVGRRARPARRAARHRSARGPRENVAARRRFARMVQSLCDDRLHCFAWDDAQAIDRESRGDRRGRPRPRRRRQDRVRPSVIPSRRTPSRRPAPPLLVGARAGRAPSSSSPRATRRHRAVRHALADSRAELGELAATRQRASSARASARASSRRICSRSAASAPAATRSSWRSC